MSVVSEDVIGMTEFEVCRVDVTHEQIDDEYTPESRSEPVVHVCGYSESGDWHHEKIRGVEPYCYVRIEDAEQAQDIDPVKRVETLDDDGDPFRSVREDRMAKVYTYDTGGVSDVDDEFTQTWESDVLFPNRFISEYDLESGVRVQRDPDEEYVDIQDVWTCTVYTDFRIHYLDIEVDDRNGFPENGVEPIICITAYDNFDDEYIVWVWGDDVDIDSYPDESAMHDASVDVRVCPNERVMLLQYLGYIQGTQPAVMSGWNLDDFDLPYLWERCQVLNAKASPSDPEIPYERMSPMGDVMAHDYFGTRVRGRAVFDLLEGVKSAEYTDLESYRLEAVAQEFIGEGKETYVGRVGDLWTDDPEKLVEYNLKDVELCVELDRRRSIIDFWREVSRFGRSQLEDATIESAVVDKYLLHVLNGDRVLPRQGSQPEVEGSYSGGAVFDAVNGLYENVPMLDLASLYPMSMLTLNISPETKVRDPESFSGDTYVSPNGIHFRKDKEGITKQIIEDLLEERNQLKEKRDAEEAGSEAYGVYDRQQRAVKVIMNSLYGVLAWNRFRLYDQDGARATTATGREVLGFTAEVSEEMGYPVLYGDTDSVLLNMDDSLSRDEVIKASFEVEDRINERYDDFASEELNAESHHFDIEFEKLYERFFQSGSKKRYAGRIRWKEGKDVDDIDITGYEYRRSDSSPLGNETQKKVLEMICEDADASEVAGYISKWLRRMDRRDVELEKIGIPEGIGRQMDDYSSPTHSVRAAKVSNLLLGTSFTSGSKPRRYYLTDVHDMLFAELEREGTANPERDPVYQDVVNDDGPRYIAVTQAEELPGECQIDWARHKKNCLKQTLSSITDALGLDWDELDSRSTQKGLDEFV